MSEWRIERVISNTINNAARGDPEELAGRIVAALADAGYYIAVREDTGSQSFDKLTPDKRPQRSNTAATSPAVCLRQSASLMRKGAEQSTSRLPAPGRSWCRALRAVKIAVNPDV